MLDAVLVPLPAVVSSSSTTCWRTGRAHRGPTRFACRDWPLHPYGDKPANYGASWGVEALPKFNTDNPEVREYLMQVGEHWMRLGIDGWGGSMLPEEIQTPGFWEEFLRERIRAP